MNPDEIVLNFNPGTLVILNVVLGLIMLGVALDVTTHGFEEAERLADRVVILAGGRVVADGTPDEIADGARLEDAYFALTGGLRDR